MLPLLIVFLVIGLGRILLGVITLAVVWPHNGLNFLNNYIMRFSFVDLIFFFF